MKLFYGWLLLFFIPSLFAENISSTLHDPTQPADYRQLDIKNNNVITEVRSIIITSKRRIALINDAYLTIGDRIGNAKIIAIEPNCIILRDAEKNTSNLCIFTQKVRQ